MPGVGSKRQPDRWWTWRWDTTSIQNAMVPHIRITRWRRGSFLTVYKMETPGSTQWWVYLPFNIGIGFSSPLSKEDATSSGDEPVQPDKSGAVPARPQVPENGKYWN